MAESGSATEMRHLASSRAQGRNSPNLSGGWVVMLLSGLIAAVLFLFATQQSSSKVAVTMLAKSVSSGQVLDASDFTRTEISAESAQLGKLVSYEDRNKFVGWVAAGPLESGDLVPRSMLREPAGTNQKRSMSIPVDKTHAVNGTLRSGDRIDVVNPDIPADDAFVARAVEVLSVDSSASTGLGSQQASTVIVAVDENQAVKISQAIRNGKFDLIRATGVQSSQPAESGSSKSPADSNASKSGSGGQ